MSHSNKASAESRAEKLAQISATLMAGWLAGNGQASFADAPVREMVELAEKIQARAERRTADARALSKD